MSDCNKVNNINAHVILGYIGAFMLALGPSWQTYKIWHTKRSVDIDIIWLLIYIVGLSFVISYLAYELTMPVLIGNCIEFVNVLIMISLKVYLERKFLCLDWDGKPEIINININDFAKVATTNKITFSIDHDEMHKILEKSNDGDDIFRFEMTRNMHQEMGNKMNAAPYIENEDQKEEDTHRKIHDSDEEFSDNDEIVYPITDI